MRTCVKFTLTNQIEAMRERSLVSVKVEPRSTSRLSSALFILPLFYLRDYNLRALTCVAKNASVEINPNTYQLDSYLSSGYSAIQRLNNRGLVQRKEG